MVDLGQVSATEGHVGPDDRPLHVLHVSEAYGGGISSAVSDYVRRTPELDHTLLMAHRRGQVNIGDEIPGLRQLDLRPGLRDAVADIRAACDRLDIDVVHAHSSYAGLYARLAVSPKDVAVVYSPHCFAFERKDMPLPARLGFHLLERGLRRRTSGIVAVSERERAIADKVIGGRPTIRVPHLPPVETPVRSAPRVDEPLTVGMVGRLCAQKDPMFFRDLVVEFHRRHPALAVRWRWIGDGETEMRDALEQAGVEVTGWFSRAEAVDALAGLDVYLHTAAWEGFPFTVIEAAAGGIPVVARRIDALSCESFPNSWPDVEELAAVVASLVSADNVGLMARRTQTWYLDYAEDSERVDLGGFYRSLLPGGRGAGPPEPVIDLGGAAVAAGTNGLPSTATSDLSRFSPTP
jgi:glycosyltransferase involved in cell wall biosynthesis